MKMTKKYRLSIAFLVLIVAGVAWFFAANHQTVPEKSRAEEWQSFKSYVAAMQLPDKPPTYQGTSTMGCFENEPVKSSSLHDCTFSGIQVYVLKGDYRENGKQIYVFLQEHGFYFADKVSQQKFETKLQNTKLRDNLSDSEPIIVDLQNKNGVWVRFSLGDKGRLMTPGSGTIEQALSGIADDGFIARLNFYKTL
jgi:hypothetical protein